MVSLYFKCCHNFVGNCMLGFAWVWCGFSFGVRFALLALVDIGLVDFVTLMGLK